MTEALDNQVGTPGYKTTSAQRIGDNNNLGPCLKIPAVPTAPTHLENDHRFFLGCTTKDHVWFDLWPGPSFPPS
ncbi:hypothetical protein [Absidia glauca]|uniref:Uncharacterized protein n=1 Tax=Absidia glauca TaxID=4829 RepID=A0A168PNF7_ABSGL|nr:hypothetical protein [Absidia glauca]